MLLVFIFNSSFAQRGKVFQQRHEIASFIENQNLEKVIFANDFYVKSLNDTVKINLLRMWEREMIYLFMGDYKALLSMIRYNDETYYEADHKRMLIKAEYRGLYPFKYVEVNMPNEYLERVVFNYLIQNYSRIVEHILIAQSLNEEERSFLVVYIHLYLFYANEQCPNEILTDMFTVAKEHIATYSYSSYNRFIRNYIIHHEYPSMNSFEFALMPIGYYFPLFGGLNNDVKSKLNLLHLNFGWNYKNAFAKLTGGFSFLKFQNYHDPFDNLGIPGLSTQAILGYEFHPESNKNWTIAPFVGMSYMLFRNRVFAVKNNYTLHEDLSPVLGIHFDYNSTIESRCNDESKLSRSFHRLQIGFSPMILESSSHTNGLAMMFQYSIGFQRNIKKTGARFY